MTEKYIFKQSLLNCNLISPSNPLKNKFKCNKLILHLNIQYVCNFVSVNFKYMNLCGIYSQNSEINNKSETKSNN